MKYLYYWIINLILIVSAINADDINYVSEITFIGNASFSQSELESVTKLHPPKFFMRSKFSPKKMNRDKIALEVYYKSRGFLGAEVTADYTSSRDKYINIKYFITEGTQYLLKGLNIYGNKLFADNDILTLLDAPTQKYYNPSKLRRNLKILKKEYLVQGKLDIAIMDDITIEEKYVTARINISEGKTYYIQNIYVSGLESVQEKYVMRELLFYNNELYNVTKINKSRKRVFDSGLFSSVEMKHQIINKELGLLDIEIKVREYKSSSVEANVGFKELRTFQNNLVTNGLDGQIRWVIGNIFNKSSNVEIKGRLASEIKLNIFSDRPLIERDFSISYRTPWTLFFRFPSRIKYFHEEESDQYKIIEDGLTYSILFNENKDTRYEFNSTFEIIQSDDSLVSSIDREPTREINFKYISNKISKPLNPEGGQYYSLSTSIYGTFLGGERHFYKMQFEYRKYLKVFERSVIALRLTGGYIYNFEDDYALPSAYQYKLGGQNSLRGWDSPNEFNNPKSALISDLINLEFRFPVWKKIGGEYFIDWGRLYDNITQISDSPIYWDYGIGLIYHTTLGPIRFDLGFPFGDLSDPKAHISLLYMF